MVDIISHDVCTQLNEGNPGWTSAAQIHNKRNWSRIYRIDWVHQIQAGRLRNAVRHGQPIVGEHYPVIWFELRCRQANHPNGPFDLCVPISTKGFSRAARCQPYDHFLDCLIEASQHYWPELHDTCILYRDNPRLEYVTAHVIGIAQPYVYNTQAYIAQHYAVLNDAFDDAH